MHPFLRSCEYDFQPPPSLLLYVEPFFKQRNLLKVDDVARSALKTRAREKQPIYLYPSSLLFLSLFHRHKLNLLPAHSISTRPHWHSLCILIVVVAPWVLRRDDGIATILYGRTILLRALVSPVVMMIHEIGLCTFWVDKQKEALFLAQMANNNYKPFYAFVYFCNGD